MQNSPSKLDIQRFVASALRASLFVSPLSYGLTLEELFTIGKEHGFQPGEIQDVVIERFELRSHDLYWLNEGLHQDGLLLFSDYEPEDPRSITAFQFIWDKFQNLDRSMGKGRGATDHKHLIAEAKEAGLGEHDIEVALGSYIAGGLIHQEHAGVLRSATITSWASPSKQLSQAQRLHDRPARFSNRQSQKLMPTVLAAINRRKTTLQVK